MKNDIRSELPPLAERVSCLFSEVHVRGNGIEQFIYAIGHGTSVEVSRHQDGGFWVEFWDCTDEDAQPGSEATFESWQAVEDGLIVWLKARPGFQVDGQGETGA